MDAVVSALADQQAELGALLDGLAAADWHAPTRCPGWDVADVVLHLAQTDEMAEASATGRFAPFAGESAGAAAAMTRSVDDGAQWMIERERGIDSAVLLERWSSGAARLVDALDAIDLSRRVAWVAGELSARTLATTRVAETWIHAGDVADALGLVLAPTSRLKLVARLAWRTLPYAFASAGRALSGPVAFHLVAPDGAAWDFMPDEAAVTTIRGPATDLCAVAARRVGAATTSLHGQGPDGEAVLALVRTYA